MGRAAPGKWVATLSELGIQCSDVSIVVPCHNAARYVEATIRSALAQSTAPVEVVVVDDGSSDDSATIVAVLAEADTRVRLVRQANSGVAQARNAGFAATTQATSYVMFLDADDVLEPDALEQLGRVLAARPDIAAVAGTCTRIDADGNPGDPSEVGRTFETYTATEHGVTLRVDGGDLRYWDIVPSNPIWTPGQCLIRRSALSTEPYRPEFTPCEDWELWLSLSRTTTIATLDRPVLKYRSHPAAATRNYDLMWAQKRRLLLAEARQGPSDRRGWFEAVYYFGLYRYGEVLCRRWAHSAWSSGRHVDALRYAVRAIRSRSREMLARRRGDFSAGLAAS